MTKDRFSQLVLQSEQTLYRIAMTMLKNETDSQDAVQSAILKAYEKLATLKKEEYFKTWLVRILINTCKKELKARSRISLEYLPERTTSSSQEDVEARLALEKLPLKIRQVIILHYAEQFSVKEISAMLRIPKGTVLSRLSRGRELLRLELE